MCEDPKCSNLQATKNALAHDLINLPVETVSDALQIASDTKHDGVNAELKQRIADCVDALHDLGVDVVCNPTDDERASDLIQTQGDTILPFGVPIPPEYGYIRVICPRCDTSDTTKCYRSGEGYAYGQCACGWGRFKKITDEWLAEWANYCANQLKDSDS